MPAAAHRPRRCSRARSARRPRRPRRRRMRCHRSQAGCRGRSGGSRAVEAPDAREQPHRSPRRQSRLDLAASRVDRPYRRSAPAAGRPVGRSTAPPTPGCACRVRLRPSFSSTKFSASPLWLRSPSAFLVEVRRRARRRSARQGRTGEIDCTSSGSSRLRREPPGFQRQLHRSLPSPGTACHARHRNRSADGHVGGT